MEKDISIMLLQKFDNFEQKLDNIEKDVSGLKEDVSSIKTRISNMKEDLTITKNSTLIMEVEHGQKIDLLLELYSTNTDSHNSYETSISNLQTITDLHSFEINLLKQSR